MYCSQRCSVAAWADQHPEKRAASEARRAAKRRLPAELRKPVALMADLVAVDDRNPSLGVRLREALADMKLALAGADPLTSSTTNLYPNPFTQPMERNPR